VRKLMLEKESLRTIKLNVRHAMSGKVLMSFIKIKLNPAVHTQIAKLVAT
jgi:hypothetical protein